MESVRRYNEREREGILWQRLHYHEGQAQRLAVPMEAIIARHHAEIERLERLERLLGIHDGEATKGAA